MLSPEIDGSTSGLWVTSRFEERAPRGARSASVQAYVYGGAASTFTANIDDVFFGDPETVFVNSFE